MGVWDDLEKQLGGGQAPNEPPRRRPPPRAPRNVSCFDTAIFSGMQGAVIGAVFGSVMGGFDCYSYGMRGSYAAQHVLRRGASTLVNFGLFLGFYQGGKCVLRKQNPYGSNVLHSALAGGVAGAASTVVQSRDPRVIGMNALVSGGIMGVLSLVFHT